MATLTASRVRAAMHHHPAAAAAAALSAPPRRHARARDGPVPLLPRRVPDLCLRVWENARTRASWRRSERAHRVPRHIHEGVRALQARRSPRPPWAHLYPLPFCLDGLGCKLQAEGAAMVFWRLRRRTRSAVASCHQGLRPHLHADRALAVEVELVLREARQEVTLADAGVACGERRLARGTVELGKDLRHLRAIVRALNAPHRSARA